MSLSTLRKNFYRIASLIVDHGAESMRCLLDQFIQTKYRMSFRDFVSNHQHEIYHHFNNGICCLCSKNSLRPFKTIISAWQMDKLFDIKNSKLSGHKYSSKCEYCCSIVKSTLQIQDIDLTLLKFVLVTYFEEEFWQSCFTSGIVFHDFLNTHKHDIFHLLQLNTLCCLCQANPGYMDMVVAEKDRLNKTQWETMFQVPELPCIQHRIPNGYPLNPCSVSAKIGIRHKDLDGRARMIILSKFCTLMMHIDVLVNARNTVFAHAIKGELTDEEFRQLWNEIEKSIIYISQFTNLNTVESRKSCILELREKSLEESLCLELQCLILKQVHGDELVLEECRKLQDTVEMVKESIDLKLQQVELKITAFTSNMSDIVRNELNQYSDTTRNIIDNTRKEIEFHDKDETYVQTSAVADATKLLESNNLLILLGKTGSGKTSTALKIASLFHANGYIIMKLEQNVATDFKTYFISNNKQLIIFEDLFGKADVRYNEDIHSNLLEVLKPHVFNGVSKFIITIRSYKSEIDDEIATYHQVLSDGRVVNLNGSSSLSDSEKNNIIKMHAKHFGREISFNERHNIVTTDPYLGFPEACHLFFSSEKLFAMGSEFFTSPTEAFQNEINYLKRSGNTNIDSALHYCVLVCLMMDFACKDSFGKNIRLVAHKSNDSSNNFKNINSSVIEYLYQSLYRKDIMITIDEIQEICKKLTYTYIKQDLSSNLYVFQHQTVFEAVLHSYWHCNTSADVIKDFKADILAEHVRPFDSILKGFKKFLIVPEDKCTDLANKLFETFLANFYEFRKCYSLIHQSKFILTEFNVKLCEWCTKEENIHNCENIIIFSVIKPFDYKEENNTICGNVDDNYLIKRLIYELQNGASKVDRYIEMYASNEFRKNFNAKVKEWFQSKDNVMNCNLDVIDYFIRPTSFTIKNGQIGTATNDCWLIQRLIIIMMNSDDVSPWSIAVYIKRYGCEEFVISFNIKLAEWFQSEENVANCEWPVINNFIRPTSFTIENGQICTVTNDGWLIQRLIHILMKPESSKDSVDTRAWSMERYIKRYGCEEFVISFNIKLAEWFQSEENVANCEWPVIDCFIRPTSFTIESGQICNVTNDGWLIQRLIHILMKPESPKDSVDTRAWNIERYIKRYGCEQFVISFNIKLAEWFQSEENVANCEWPVIDYFIRPTSFTIENGQICTVTNDGWLIQSLIHLLMKPASSKDSDTRAWNIERYIKRYGCEEFVISFNIKLAEWFQSEENVANCEWPVIDYFIRPTSFTIENGQICTVTNDGWLIQRLIHILMKPESSKDSVDTRAWNIERYIKRFGCEQFVISFNIKLAEWFQSEENVANCEWPVIDYFIRPTSFTIENGQICTVTNDGWLIQSLIHLLMKPASSKDSDTRAWNIERYIKRYGCEEFVISFNIKLAEWFQSEENVANCEWPVIDYFIRPTSFTIENGQICTVTNDGWLIQRLIHILMKPESSKDSVDFRAWNIERYIKRYGCEEFVISFNIKLAEWFQSEENVANCEWPVIDYFIRPTSFTIENGQICTVTNDGWLIQSLIHLLMKPASSKDSDTRAWNIERYIKRYGSEQFVISFNIKLAEWFQSEENVANCEWPVIDYFIRPTSFTIENGQICTVTNDGWLIQRLIHILMKPESSKDSVDTRAWNIERYIKRYGCEQFVISLNIKLAEWFQSEENVANCEWPVINKFIRPTSFTIENGQICTVTNDGWLIQRLIHILMKPESSKDSVDTRAWSIERYIKRYGCEEFVISFNIKLAEWFQSEENVANCEWPVIDYFIRPTSFTIENGQICTVTNDGWLIQRLIHILMKPESYEDSVDTRAWSIERYIKRYGCEEFVISFNIKLAEWFQSEENVANCEWPVIDYFIRPTSFTIENGQICTVTNDGWLIQRLIHILMKPESSEDSVDTRARSIERYIKRYGCEEFVISFNIKLAEWFQSEENVANCEWPVIDYFIRPTSFTIENGQICTVTNDGWLIQRLIHILMKPESSIDSVDTRARSIERYIKRYGCEEFVISFNIKLAEWFQAEENVVNCNLHLFTSFVRPQSWLCFEKIGIYIQDERVVMYLFSKLEQPKNINAVKSYIRSYGSNDFITNFNERLKEKVEINPAFDQQCTWECLERFFDNVASYDANDINDFSQGFDIDMGVVTETDSSISIDTNSHSADSETDSNIDVDSSNSSEDSESDSNMDDDSSNQHSDNETSHQPSWKGGCKNGVLTMKE